VPEARGSVLVRPLICSQLTECTACLLYVQCIWCAGNATCFARDVATNMPVDTGMILRAAPNPDWNLAGQSCMQLRPRNPTFMPQCKLSSAEDLTLQVGQAVG